VSRLRRLQTCVWLTVDTALQAAGLERFLTRKLQPLRAHPPNAAATSLALWLLEIILARQHSSPDSASAPAGSPTVPHAQPASDTVPAGRQQVADRAHLTARTGRDGWMTAMQLLEEFKAHMPYHVVEQMLRESGCRGELAAAARLYGNWQALFSLLLPGALRCA
jgi:hypothetical protein